MIMSKIIRKLRPADYWRIGEHESWFTDMAANGLHLKKMGIHFAHFTKGEPMQMRYRIDASTKKKVSPQQLEMYAESGWDYVTSYGFFHVYSSPTERQAPEIHTDPAEQSYTLKELDKKLALNASMVVIATILMIGMLSSLWFLDGTPTLTLVQGIALQQTLLSLFIGYSAYHSLRAAISIRALRKNLIEGKPVNHHAPWKKHHRFHTVISFIFTVIVGLSAIIPFTQLAKSEAKTLPEASGNLPIVRLADVEQNPALMRAKDPYISDSVDWGNHYTFDWSPFAPVQYDTDESGIVPGELWEDQSGEYSPSLHTRVFQLRIPAMADDLISDLIKWDNFKYSEEDFVEKQHPELDSLIVLEDQESKEVFASKGKAVIYVQYHGYADIDSVIENVVEKIALISD